MELTKEQKAIIEDTVTNKDGIYGIGAAAGSGKSFTIFRAIDFIKEHKPNAKILYLVFNKRNQVEAEQKLRKYMSWLQPVIVKTAHSYAHTKWTKVIGDFTVIQALDWNVIQDIKTGPTYKYNYELIYSKKKPFLWLHDEYCSSKLVLKSFCESMREHWEDSYDGPNKPGDITITTSNGYKKQVFGIPLDGYSYVTKAHIDAFEDIMEEHMKRKWYTHGMYLKAAAYSKKTGGDKFDYVFFDEAQDASFFMLKLLEKQEIKKMYFVGDERQSIYQFGCNVNVFKELKFDKEYSLTTSFRFGKNVADLATSILSLNSTHKVFGTEQTHEINPLSVARLYRTNATLFQEALDCAYNAKLHNIPLYIDLMKTNEDEAAINELLSFLKLYYKYKKNSYFRQNESLFPKFVVPALSEFEKALERGEDFLDIYNEQYDFLSDNIHKMFAYAQKEENFVEKYRAYQDCLNNTQGATSKIAFITMHRSKGMEWDNVTIAEPTRLYYTDKDGTKRRNPEYMQELNLAYVAVTRARKTLNAEILRTELSDERGLFDNICFTIIDGKLAYTDKLKEEIELDAQYEANLEELDDAEIDIRPSRNDSIDDTHWHGFNSSDVYDDKDVCSKTYDPFLE